MGWYSGLWAAAGPDYNGSRRSPQGSWVEGTGVPRVHLFAHSGSFWNTLVPPGCPVIGSLFFLKPQVGGCGVMKTEVVSALWASSLSSGGFAVPTVWMRTLKLREV